MVSAFLLLITCYLTLYRCYWCSFTGVNSAPLPGYRAKYLRSKLKTKFYVATQLIEWIKKADVFTSALGYFLESRSRLDLVLIFRPTVAIGHIGRASNTIFFIGPFAKIDHLALFATKWTERTFFAPNNLGATLWAGNFSNFAHNNNN